MITVMRYALREDRNRVRITAVLLCAFSFAAADLAADYQQTLARADSLYFAGRHEPALAAYRVAHGLLPSELGPQVGIGWSYFRLGAFAEAESTFRAVLRQDPEQTLAQQGLQLVPRNYPYRVTLSGTRALGIAGASILAGYVERNWSGRSVLTLGMTYTLVDTWRAGNTAVIYYQRLDYHTSARVDFFMLWALNNWRYWQVVVAPSLTRSLDQKTWLRLTLLGWDNFRIWGGQLTASREFTSRFGLRTEPVVNFSPGRIGWLAPLEARYAFLPVLTARAYLGAGSITGHVDLNVPSLYNRPDTLQATARLGVDYSPGRLRFQPTLVWERYAGRPDRLFGALTASVRF